MYDENIEIAIQTLRQLQGLNLEVCGTWLWIGGDTKQHKEKIKELGGHWAPKKKLWYITPPNTMHFRNKERSIEDIRETHGCTFIGKVVE